MKRHFGDSGVTEQYPTPVKIALIRECGNRYYLWKQGDYYEVYPTNQDPPKHCMQSSIKSALRAGLTYPRPNVTYLCTTANLGHR